MSSEFWIGLAALPVAAILVMAAVLMYAHFPDVVFRKCRHGHRIDLISDRDDPKSEHVAGTVWECLTCEQAWKVVSTARYSGNEIPHSVSLQKSKKEGTA